MLKKIFHTDVFIGIHLQRFNSSAEIILDRFLWGFFFPCYMPRSLVLSFYLHHFQLARYLTFCRGTPSQLQSQWGMSAAFETPTKINTNYSSTWLFWCFLLLLLFLLLLMQNKEVSWIFSIPFWKDNYFYIRRYVFMYIRIFRKKNAQKNSIVSQVY